MYIDPSGFNYNEFYLYSQKMWEMAASGSVTHDLSSALMQNAPVIVTSSGFQNSTPSDPWGQYNGLGKYSKVGFGDFTLNSDGTIDKSKKEFAIHPDSSGRLVFNQALKENTFIEYEAGPSGYYIFDTVDVNPIINHFGGGFLHFSENEDVARVSLSSTYATISADGYHFTRLTATLLDSLGDSVTNKSITFFIPDDLLGYFSIINGSGYAVGASGHITEVVAVTNAMGQARVNYYPIRGQTGMQFIKAYPSDNPSVFDFVQITQIYNVGNPFILDSSLLDSLDYLT